MPVIFIILIPLLAFHADVTAQTETPQSAFIWTDSLIAARGPFATPPPPEIARPDTIDGKLYWLGGVFVLPGTAESVLTEHGFLDIEQKPGSVMHDYYEARWPMEMVLDSLPLEIRQVRYHRKAFEFDPSWHDIVDDKSRFIEHIKIVNIELLTIPGLSETFFATYGFKDIYQIYPKSWCTVYHRWWPENLNPSNAPPELYGFGKVQKLDLPIEQGSH